MKFFSIMQTPVQLGPFARDVAAGVVVFLVALPLCLGVALASNAPLLSGVLAGIVGGLVVGTLSGSHTSVAGPAAGLTAIVAAEVASLGSFESVLLATMLAGAIQIVLGLARLGFIAAFFPSSVIKGLLAAIGLLLILKQLPHLFGVSGVDSAAEGLLSKLGIQPGAALIGLLSIAVLVAWERTPRLKTSLLPAPLVVVALGVLAHQLLAACVPEWALSASYLVRVPVADQAQSVLGLLQTPDWSGLANPAVYGAAVTLAVVASLETLLNLEAVDRLDPKQRHSPPSRELCAQGVGNLISGLIGGLPVTSVIVRSSVNINARNETRRSTILHGALLLVSVLFAASLLNRIPLACLAAILITTGVKLASPRLVQQLWREGRPQFLPFAVTVLGILATDLLKGIVVGLVVALGFILHSNFRRPLRRVLEKHITGDVLRIELSNQVSFLNRAALERALHSVPQGGHVLVDARNSDYIDPDILDLLDDYKGKYAPAHAIDVSCLGFRDRYPRLEDQIQYVDYSSRDVRDALTPEQVLQILREGNLRFQSGQRLTRDLVRQVNATARGQSPMAVVLSCIDSRTPAELIFDLGIGDVFVIRIAGNIARDKVLGSMEFGTLVAGAKLILVLGHTSCGAVKAAVELAQKGQTAEQAMGCTHLDVLVSEIQRAIDPELPLPVAQGAHNGMRESYVDEVARRNVQRTMAVIRQQSSALDRLVREGKLAIVGGLYDVRTGEVNFFALDGAISESALAEWERPGRKTGTLRRVTQLPEAPQAAS
jgi:carbonic anhydrase/SulP family sulfate permease